jgi:hypothetical protein
MHLILMKERERIKVGDRIELTGGCFQEKENHRYSHYMWSCFMFVDCVLIVQV